MLNNLVAWAYATGRVYIKSDGTPWRPIVHIADISRAFIAAMQAPIDMVHNEAFNVGRNEDNYRIYELADIVKETVPNTVIEYAAEAGPDKRCYRVDCSKIRKVLPAFQPAWDARKGALELYKASAKNGHVVEDFEGPRFKRIAHIRKLIEDGLLDSSLRWNNQEATAPVVAGAAQYDGIDLSLPRCILRSRSDSFLRNHSARGCIALADQLGSPEVTAPLDLVFCPECSLVQITETVPPEILFCRNYPYFSSVSKSLLEHFAGSAEAVIQARGLDTNSLVVEAASNDGYMLRNFVNHGIPVLGIDPAEEQVRPPRTRRQQHQRFLYPGAGKKAGRGGQEGRYIPRQQCAGSRG